MSKMTVSSCGLELNRSPRGASPTARRGCIPGPGGILHRLCEHHLLGVLREELDHTALKGGLPTLALCDFPSLRFGGHPNQASLFTPPHPSLADTGPASVNIRFPLFLYSKVQPQKLTAHRRISRRKHIARKGGKSGSDLIRGPCFLPVMVQTSPARDSE